MYYISTVKNIGQESPKNTLLEFLRCNRFYAWVINLPIYKYVLNKLFLVKIFNFLLESDDLMLENAFFKKVYF